MANTTMITFDCSGYDYDDAEWDRICHEVSEEMEAASLPSLFGERWEESDGGCVFEGSKEEIARVRNILLKYQITVFD